MNAGSSGALMTRQAPQRGSERSQGCGFKQGNGACGATDGLCGAEDHTSSRLDNGMWMVCGPPSTRGEGETRLNCLRSPK